MRERVKVDMTVTLEVDITPGQEPLKNIIDSACDVAKIEVRTRMRDMANTCGRNHGNSWSIRSASIVVNSAETNN